MICCSRGSKSRLAKAAGAEPSGQMRDEKVHAVVARSAFPSQNVQSTPASEHFWKLRCGKIARRCGAKHISKSKVLKTDSLGPLVEVQMSKMCTPLWREAHSKSKCLSAPLLHVEASFCVAGARVSKNERGTFEEGLQRWILRGRRSTRDMFIRDVRRSGR